MLKIAIVSSDTGGTAQLIAALQQTGLVGSVWEWDVSANRIPDATDEVPDVLLVDLSRDTEVFLSFGSHVKRLHPTTRLVALSISSPPTHQLMLEAMRGGVQDFLPKPVSLEALKEMLSRFVDELQGNEPSFLDKLIIVMGAKGGVGTTTVAVNLGVQLSVIAHKRVVLLDFARPFGNAHLMLDVHTKFGVRDAVDSLERLDDHFFAGLLTQHKTKLQLLAGATQPEEWQTIAVPSLERVINVAQNSFDSVLVDVGSQLSEEWGPILRKARLILMITETNVLSLWTLQRRFVALTGFGVDPERARIVVNRWHRNDEEVFKSIEKDLKRPVFATIPNDFGKASTSANMGTPLLEKHNNGLCLRYQQIAAQIAGIDALPNHKKVGLGGLFSFSTKRGT